MRKIISALLALTMIFASMLSLSSCGEPKDAGAEIKVYIGETVFDFDPSDYYVDSNADQVMSLLYEPLFSVTKKGKIKCAGAESYEVNKEKREIVIQLRETYWSDETRVKAADYIYAWRDVILNPNNANPAAALFYGIDNAAEIKSGIDGVSLYSFGAKDTGVYEITINYAENADYKQILKNLASVATSPLRQDIVSSAATYWSKDMTSIVTNGPFKISELNVDAGNFALARNLGYHQKSTVKNYTENVKPNKLISFTTPEGKELTITYNDLANKTVFYMGNASLADRKEHKSSAKRVDDLSTYTYVFNTENPLFAIKEVRQALSLALDRQAIVEAITFAKPANGFLPDPVAKSIYGKKIANRLEGSVADAEALLAGVNFDGISKAFTLTVNDDEESRAIADIAKTAWTALGFTVTVNAVSSRATTIIDSATSEEMIIKDSEIQRLVKEASYGNREFDIIGIDWQMYSTDAFVALAAFTSNINGNGRDFSNGTVRTAISGFCSADYDNYLNVALNASNDEDRDAALREAEKLLLDSASVVPVVYNQSFAFVNKDLTKISTDAFGNFGFKNVKLKNYRKYLESEED